MAPSAAPAPTTVCSSSMNVMIWPSLSLISFSTALSRSSNSPRYFAPATIAPRSSAISRLPRSDSGTSPATTRWARPSTTAVLPTPGSPMRTGLFLVRRDSTWITRRISASRPITGSRSPDLARSVRSIAVLLQRLVGALRVLRGDPGVPADLVERLDQRVGAGPGLPQQVGHVATAGGQADEQVLGGDELVAELPGPLGGGVDRRQQRPRRLRCAHRGACRLGQPGQQVLACRAARRPGSRRPPAAAEPRCRRPARSARPAGAPGSTCGWPAAAALRTAVLSASWLLRVSFSSMSRCSYYVYFGSSS